MYFKPAAFRFSLIAIIINTQKQINYNPAILALEVADLAISQKVRLLVWSPTVWYTQTVAISFLSKIHGRNSTLSLHYASFYVLYSSRPGPLLALVAAGVHNLANLWHRLYNNKTLMVNYLKFWRGPAALSDQDFPIWTRNSEFWVKFETSSF